MIYIGAPYKRTYKHSKNTGKESTVRCEFCGKTVPRWKSFIVNKGFRISDPFLRKNVDRRTISSSNIKTYACPSCARYRGIVEKGRSRKSRTK